MPRELDERAVNALSKMASAWERIANCAERDLELKAESVKWQAELCKNTEATKREIDEVLGRSSGLGA